MTRKKLVCPNCETVQDEDRRYCETCYRQLLDVKPIEVSSGRFARLLRFLLILAILLLATRIGWLIYQDVPLAFDRDSISTVVPLDSIREALSLDRLRDRF